MSQRIACDGAMPMLAPETLALVTVTHNSAAELEALLTSIERHLPGVELVVVDSASSDETVAVARSGRRVQTIGLEQNVGFGRGCNTGVGSFTVDALAYDPNGALRTAKVRWTFRCVPGDPAVRGDVHARVERQESIGVLRK